MKANTNLKILIFFAFFTNFIVQRVLSSQEVQGKNLESKIMTPFTHFTHHSGNYHVLSQINFNFQEALNDSQFKKFIKGVDPVDLVSKTEKYLNPIIEEEIQNFKKILS